MDAFRSLRTLSPRRRLAALVGAFFILPAGAAGAHCDTMDGPVVLAAQRALETGNPDHVLIWVGVADDPSVRRAFDKTLRVRALGDEARELADRWFFETVVRLHRAGEGEAYTGLKPAGTDPGPGVVPADEAIERGSPSLLIESLTERMSKGVRDRYAEVMGTKGFRSDDVEAGRKHVASYVGFVHYVSNLDGAIEGASGPHARAGMHGLGAHEGEDAHGSHGVTWGGVAGLSVPEPLAVEHERLHETLKRATEESGRTGDAAERVVEVLLPHFQRENEIALPPLSLLGPLAYGQMPADPGRVLRLTDELEHELPRMLEEHEAIIEALEGLRAAAEREGKGEYVAFAEEMILHAQTEELVLYPAAILVGERVRDGSARVR